MCLGSNPYSHDQMRAADAQWRQHQAAMLHVQAPRPWESALRVGPHANLADCERAYRKLARGSHPDAGGSVAEMARLNAAIAEARKVLR